MAGSGDDLNRGHFLSRGRTSFVNFTEDILDGILVAPIRVVLLEFTNITDIPDVIADTVILEVGKIELVPGELLSDSDGLEHGAVRMAASPDVVDFAHTRVFVKVEKGGDEIVRVDVITDLLSFVSEDAVGAAFDDALHEVSQEAVKFCTSMSGTSEATSTEHSRLHAEVAAVFLDENICGDFAGSK